MLPTIRLSLLVCLAYGVAFGCSCGRPARPMSDEDATRAAIPAWETMTALTPSAVPPPTPTPIPPLVAPKTISPEEITDDGLYVVDTQSGAITRVGGSMWLQAWLPDGRMAVIGGIDGQRMYLIDPAGGRVIERFPDSPNLTISPDGKRIAFEPLDIASPSGDVAVSQIDDPESGNVLVHVADNIRSLSWSADSEWIATESAQGTSLTSSIAVVRANGPKDVRTLGDARSFAWSPSGAQIVLLDSETVKIFDLVSGQARQRSLPAAVAEMIGPVPPFLALSTDSRYLALGFDESVAVLPIDGTGGIEIDGAFFSGWRSGSDSLVVSGAICGTAPLTLVGADGTIERIFGGPVVGAARLSPDGSRAAFVSEGPSGTGSVEIAELDTGEERSLFSVSGYPGLAAWSADGRSLAFGGLGGKPLPFCQGNSEPEFDIHPIQ